MKASTLAAAALFTAAAAGLSGQTVTLDDCLRLGFAHDSGLKSDELETQAADARIHEMQGQYAPSLSIQGGYSRLSDVAPGSMSIALSPPIGTQTITFPPTLDNSTSFRLALQQPLFTGRRISGSIRQAEALRDSSRGDLARTRLDLRYTITEAYWSLARAKAQHAAIAQSVSQADSHLADARKLLEQGMATNNDVLQAEIRREDAGIELASAASFRDISRARLAVLLGLSWGASLDIPDAPTPTAQMPQESLGDLVSQALANRPELASARSRASAQEAAIDVARSGLFPSVFVTGDYTFANPNQRVFPQTDEFVGTWSIGVLASIDVGRFPQYLAQEKQAQTRLAQARESSQRLADAVTTDVIRAYLTLGEAVGRSGALHRETAQAEENDRVMQERYREGIALSSESLDAQVLVVRARLREDGALFDSLIAQAALQRALGE